MNITEIEEKINHPNLHPEFRKLDSINKVTLYKKLCAENILRSRNSYFSYDTRLQLIDDIAKDIKEKIEAECATKESSDEVVAFLENESSRLLFVVIWHYPKKISLESLYKRANRYNKLGALV